MKNLDNINIPLLPKGRDEVILNLLVTNISKTQVAIEETLKLKLLIQYKDQLTNDIVKQELEKLSEKTEEIRYGLLADIHHKFGASEAEVKASKLDLNSSIAKTFEVLSDMLIELSKQFPKNDEQQPDKLDGY